MTDLTNMDSWDLFCKPSAPSELTSRTVTLYSLPPQDMEVCADELKNILNTVVNKREWPQTVCGGRAGRSGCPVI